MSASKPPRGSFERRAIMGLSLVGSVGQVTDQYPQRRDNHGLPNPAIAVAARTVGGMSGGAAFDAAGHLIGVIIKRLRRTALIRVVGVAGDLRAYRSQVATGGNASGDISGLAGEGGPVRHRALGRRAHMDGGRAPDGVDFRPKRWQRFKPVIGLQRRHSAHHRRSCPATDLE